MAPRGVQLASQALQKASKRVQNCPQEAPVTVTMANFNAKQQFVVPNSHFTFDISQFLPTMSANSQFTVHYL